MTLEQNQGRCVILLCAQCHFIEIIREFACVFLQLWPDIYLHTSEISKDTCSINTTFDLIDS